MTNYFIYLKKLLLSSELTNEPEIESRIYLDDASWDLKKAIESYNDDSHWSIENSNVFISHFEKAEIKADKL